MIPSMPDRVAVWNGLDVLLRDSHPVLDGARIGLVTNHTAITRDFRHIVDALHSDERFELVQIFAPEHGVRGSAQAGDLVGDEVDLATGLPVISLYGSNRIPTAEQLADMDVVIFDIQDAGARHYTYISTMVHVMRACAPLNLPVMVLDRPNPITGLHTEGKVLEQEFVSFVGIHPMPTRHGLTMGELTMLIAAELKFPAPTVIACEGWSRDLWWDDTDLPFISPSPNLPTLDSLLAYTATCPLEATTLSEGRGTTRPFEVFGAPWVDAIALADDLNRRHLVGVHFRPIWFTPWFSKHREQLCGGVQIHVTNRDAFRPVATGVHIIHSLAQLPDSDFAWQTGPALGMSHGRLYGGTELHEMIASGNSAEEITASWQPELHAVINRAKDFHLYELKARS